MERSKAEKRRVDKERRREKEKESEERRYMCAKHCVLLMICGPGGSKGRLAKAAGAESPAQMSN